MARKSISQEDKPGFRECIPGYTDGEIREILKKRNHYRQEAAELAIHEAIKRGIIKGEDDLSLPDFQEDSPQKFSFFPVIDDEVNKLKIRKSISRMLILAGIIPLIFGVRYLQGSWISGMSFIIVGLIWMIFSFLLFRRYNQRLVIALFLILLLSFVVVAIQIVTLGNPGFIDIFAVLVFYFLFGYGLLFLRRIGA